MKGAEFGFENHFCAVNKNPDEFRTRNLLTNNFYVKKIATDEKKTQNNMLYGCAFAEKFSHLEKKQYTFNFSRNPSAAEVLLNAVNKDIAMSKRAGTLKLLSYAVDNKVLGSEFISDFEVNVKEKKADIEQLLTYNSEFYSRHCISHEKCDDQPYVLECFASR